MSTHLRRSDRRRQKNLIGVTALIVVGCLLVGAVFLRISVATQTRGLDNCTPDGPSALNIIAIDVTDELSGVQRLALRNEFVRILESLDVDEAIQIWRVAPSVSEVPEAAGPLLCNPGNVANRWFQNPGQVEAAYTERFWTPLMTQMDALLEGSASDASPIMESLQAMALRVFDNPDFAGVARRRLVLASDMIQNTPAHSQLRGVEPFEAFEQTRIYRQLRTDLLAGVRVEILYIRRPSQPPYGEHIYFWRRYFSASGALFDSVVPVTGLSGEPAGA